MIPFYLLPFLFALVSANTEKVIFTAPAPVPIPLAKPSISDLNLKTLTHDVLSIRTNLSRVFPSDTAVGKDTWLVLDNLTPGQRYELRVCWSALQPTWFNLETYELDTVWSTPELIQSLSAYAYSRQDATTQGDDAEEPQVHDPSQEEGQREASILFLLVQSAADYFTDDVSLMNDPPPVLVDLILDPYLFNLLPESLIPTIGYLILVGIATWFVARTAASKLRTFASMPEETSKKQN